MESTMRSGMMLAAAGLLVLGSLADVGARDKHLNPMIELHAQKKPLFGLYAPSNPRGRGNRAGAPGAAAPGTPAAAAPATPPPATPAPVLKTPAELAKDALAYDKSDFIFDGTMEGGVDRGMPAFTTLVGALADAAPPAD